MKSDKKFIIAGGDLRQIYLAEKFSEVYDTVVTGFEKYKDRNINNVDIDDIENNSADGIILPLPVSSDGIYISTAFSDRNISMEMILLKLKKNGKVYGGKFTSEIIRMLESKNIYFSDYLQREEFSILNAVSTAEGALQTALEKSDRTIYGQNILITGFGRIAKALARILLGMGAYVTVAARKKSDMTWAEIYGCKSCNIKEIENICGSYDIIFNTVPSMIFDEDILCKLKKDVLFIDLASKPGGADFKSAQKLGINAVHALALPGKTAPESAGYAIAYSVMNIIDERGEMN
jgi:dipicolinate synthase subunit A